MPFEEAIQHYLQKENISCITRDERGRVTGTAPNKIPGFIITGQSNAKGRDNNPLNPSSYDLPDPRIQQWPAQGDVNEPVIASNPLLHPYKDDNIVGSNIGPGLSFAHALLDATTLFQEPIFSEIHLLPAAVSDESIDIASDGGFAPNSGVYYSQIIEQAQRFLNANTNHCLAGILMHQGETDSGYGARYTDILSTWVQSIRRDLDSPELPIITGTFSQDWVEDKLGWSSLYWWEPSLTMKAELQNAIKQISSNITNVYTANLIDLPSLVGIGDQIHFSADSSREHGIRAAHAFLNIVKPEVDNYEPAIQPEIFFHTSTDQRQLTRLSWTQSDGTPFPDYELIIKDRETEAVIVQESGLTGLSYTLPSPLPLMDIDYSFQITAHNTVGSSPTLIRYPNLRPSNDLPPSAGDIEVIMKQNQDVYANQDSGLTASFGQDVESWGSAYQADSSKQPQLTTNGLIFNQLEGDFLTLTDENSLSAGNTYIIHFTNIDSSTDNVLFGNSEFVFWYRGKHKLLSAFNPQTGETLVRKENVSLNTNSEYIFALTIGSDNTSTLFEANPLDLSVQQLSSNTLSADSVLFNNTTMTLGNYPYNSQNSFSGIIRNAYFTNSRYSSKDIQHILSNGSYFNLSSQ